MNREEKIPMFDLHTGKSVEQSIGDDSHGGILPNSEEILEGANLPTEEESEPSEGPVEGMFRLEDLGLKKEEMELPEQEVTPQVRATVPVAPVERRPPTESADNSLSAG